MIKTYKTMSNWPALLVLVMSRWINNELQTNFHPNRPYMLLCWWRSHRNESLHSTFLNFPNLLLIPLWRCCFCFSDNYCNANNIFRTVMKFGAQPIFIVPRRWIPQIPPNFPLAQTTKLNMWLEMKHLHNYWMEKSGSWLRNHFSTPHTLVYDPIATFLCSALISKHTTTCD